MSSLSEQKRETKLVRFELVGNLFDHSWYQHICHDNGKTDFCALTILADIVYWYRPQYIRGEKTGDFTEGGKKFKADFLQRSRRDFEKKFHMTTQQVRDALALLEKLGFIKRHFRTIEIEDGITLSNVLYIELNVDKVEAISTCSRTTFGESTTVDTGGLGLQTTPPLTCTKESTMEELTTKDEDPDGSVDHPLSVYRRGGVVYRPRPHYNTKNTTKKFKTPHKYPPSGGVPPFGGGGVKNTPNAPSRGGAPKGANVFGGGSKAKTPTKAVRKKTPPMKTDPFVIAFETFWSTYPRKLRKTDAQKQFLANLEKGHDIQAMLDSTKLYSDYCKKNEIPARFIKTPPAFLKDVWNDEGSIQEWSTMETQQKPKKIPFSQMPQDAKQKLQRLLADKQLSDEYGNPLTERSGVIWEFLDTGFWDSLPQYVQKAVVDFKWPEGSQPKPQPQNAPEPDGWRDYIIKAYGNTPRMQGYVKDGWNSISLSTRWDLVREMQQEDAKQQEPKNSG